MTIYKQLNQLGYICSPDFAEKVELAISCQPTKGAFLIGSPGTGKSKLPEVLAHILKADLLFYQMFPGTREEDLICTLLPDDNKVSGITLSPGVLIQAAKKSHNNRVIITLDEWDKCRPSCDSFLLDFLQTGRIYFKDEKVIANLDNLIVFITMNYEREISDALMRRLPAIHFEHLHPNTIKDIIAKNNPNSKYIDAAVLLYIATISCGLSKPATVQELNQLINAMERSSTVGWDTLIKMFITKTEENHQKLVKWLKENKTIAYNPEEQRDEVPVTPFNNKEAEVDITEKPVIKRVLPRRKVKKHEPIDESPDSNNKYTGVIDYSIKAYNALVKYALGEENEIISKNENIIVMGNNEFAEVKRINGQKVIVMNKRFSLRKINVDNFINLMKVIEGEICFTETSLVLSKSLIRKFQKHGLVVTHLTDEICVGYLESKSSTTCKFGEVMIDNEKTEIIFNINKNTQNAISKFLDDTSDFLIHGYPNNPKIRIIRHEIATIGSIKIEVCIKEGKQYPASTGNESTVDAEVKIYSKNIIKTKENITVSFGEDVDFQDYFWNISFSGTCRTYNFNSPEEKENLLKQEMLLLNVSKKTFYAPTYREAMIEASWWYRYNLIRLYMKYRKRRETYRKSILSLNNNQQI